MDGVCRPWILVKARKIGSMRIRVDVHRAECEMAVVLHGLAPEALFEELASATTTLVSNLGIALIDAFHAR
jgi:hypothetical protein